MPCCRRLSSDAWMIAGALRAKLLRRLRAEPDRFLRQVPGVIHVGANTGQERDRYRALGLRVLWIEPIPAVFTDLVANIRDYPGQTAIQALLTDVDGKMYDFNVASNGGQSSSVLELHHHREIWPDIAYTNTLRLKSMTLPTVLADYGITPAEYPALVLDTQGSELLVLEGALPILSNFQFIKAEVADFESYVGCCQVSDLGGFLKQQGYRELSRSKFASRAGGGHYFDIVYQRLA